MDAGIAINSRPACRWLRIAAPIDSRVISWNLPLLNKYPLQAAYTAKAAKNCKGIYILGPVA